MSTAASGVGTRRRGAEDVVQSGVGSVYFKAFLGVFKERDFRVERGDGVCERVGGNIRVEQSAATAVGKVPGVGRLFASGGRRKRNDGKRAVENAEFAEGVCAAPGYTERTSGDDVKDIIAKFCGMESGRFRYFFIFAANDEDIEFSVETGIDGSRKIVERESALTSAEKK